MPYAGGYDGCDELFVQVDRVIWFFASTLMMALAGILVYIYYFQKGQFEDSEDVKYQMFREEEE